MAGVNPIGMSFEITMVNHLTQTTHIIQHIKFSVGQNIVEQHINLVPRPNKPTPLSKLLITVTPLCWEGVVARNSIESEFPQH
jgi:hypothetical protein